MKSLHEGIPGFDMIIIVYTLLLVNLLCITTNLGPLHPLVLLLSVPKSTPALLNIEPEAFHAS